jgi:FMNH2-dependent dimethyl sulfone monooxygenase
MKFGLWAPVYGGWLRIKNEYQHPSYEMINQLANVSELNGYDYIYFSENYLNCVYGPDYQVADAWVMATAVAASTKNINVVAATKPGFQAPLPIARMAQSIQELSQGRFSMNMVCGWWKREFDQCDVDYLDHQKRYERANEFVECLKLLWRHTKTDYAGVYYKLNQALIANHDDNCKKIPIWVSGHSDNAIELAVKHGDVLCLDSMSDEELKQMIARIRLYEDKHNKKIEIAMSAFIVIGETTTDSKAIYESIIDNRDKEVIEMFRKIMAESGATMWSDLTDKQMVDSNCGLDAGLIGSAEIIIQELNKLEDFGVNIILCQFKDMYEDSIKFGEKVIQLIKPH